MDPFGDPLNGSARNEENKPAQPVKICSMPNAMQVPAPSRSCRSV
jgi:hypothetical protein